METYRYGPALARGACGTLWIATEPSSQRHVAIKCVSKDIDPRVVENARLEGEAMLSFDHPFIVPGYETFEDERNIYSVMEFCPGGTLADAIQKGPLPEERAAMLLTELLLAIRYLHNDCHILHRDIKPDNILFDSHGHIRLVDFGFLTDLDCNSALLRTACGSPAFSAPEVMRREEYNTQADIWSFGVVMYVTLVGHLPFQEANIMKYMQRIICDEIEIPSNLSDDARDLLHRLLDKNWQTRITIDDILLHPWICRRPTFNKLMSLSTSREKLHEQALNDGDYSPYPTDSVAFKTHRDAQISRYISHVLSSSKLESWPRIPHSASRSWRTVGAAVRQKRQPILSKHLMAIQTVRRISFGTHQSMKASLKA